jgi:hypothetical protein
MGYAKQQGRYMDYTHTSVCVCDRPYLDYDIHFKFLENRFVFPVAWDTPVAWFIH